MFVDDENTPLVNQYDKIREGDHDDYHGDYNTPNNTVKETGCTTPTSTDTQSTSALQHRQKVKKIS